MRYFAAALLFPLALGGCAGGPGDPSADAYSQSIDDWHAQRIDRLRSDTGWLTLAGLHPLETGRHALGSDPAGDIVLPAAAPAHVGTLVVTDDRILLEPAPDAEATIFEGPVTTDGDAIVMDSDAAGPPTVLATGPILFQVIDRGGSRFLRVRDRQSATLAAFRGIDRYPVDPAFRTSATLIPEPNATVGITNILGLVETSPTPGLLEFELRGRTYRLRPTRNSDGSLFIVFADATNGRGTYPAGRFLSADPVGTDGTVVLDFNKAYNPVCALTAHATCPLPPPGNRLDVAIEAGEKAPR